MRMRQSTAQLERAFQEEQAEEHLRRVHVRRLAAERARKRQSRRTERHGTLRFVGLLAAILATSAIVTVVMFKALALLVG